jgi:hypothetical protein
MPTVKISIILVKKFNIDFLNSLFLEHEQLVGFHVAHVERLALDFDEGMLFGRQPADVRVPKSSPGVVRVGVCVTVLVVQPVVAHPNVHAVLQSQQIAIIFKLQYCAN